ncbi:MAG TPA: hypothetical protein VGZ47_09790 [Gemmataceae bacterium]|jgi:hypothetical protein|nr:hypothetical protein [Gemmataceae bacterium]
MRQAAIFVARGRILKDMRQKATTFGIIFVIIAGILLTFDYLYLHFDDGAFPLQVNLVSKNDRSVNRVSVAVLMYEQEATTLSAEASRFDSVLMPVNWKPGSPFVVNVVFGGEYSGLGRELNYGQARILAIRVEYADGKIEYVTTEIPDGRRQREITVEVP